LKHENDTRISKATACNTQSKQHIAHPQATAPTAGLPPSARILTHTRTLTHTQQPSTRVSRLCKVAAVRVRKITRTQARARETHRVQKRADPLQICTHHNLLLLSRWLWYLRYTQRTHHTHHCHHTRHRHWAKRERQTKTHTQKLHLALCRMSLACVRLPPPSPLSSRCHRRRCHRCHCRPRHVLLPHCRRRRRRTQTCMHIQ